MGVHHEPYKTTLLDLHFLGILSKVYQNWDPKGGAKPPQIFSKSTFDCRGSPWGPLFPPYPSRENWDLPQERFAKVSPPLQQPVETRGVA